MLHYISHSFGGLALSLFAEKHPLNKMSKLVFIAPATETTTALHFFSQKLGISDQLKVAISDHIFKRSGQKAEYFSIRRSIRTTHHKILWIHDLNDDVTPWSDAEKVKKDNHPNITFVNTTGLGHRKIYKDSQVTKMVVKFIDEA